MSRNDELLELLYGAYWAGAERLFQVLLDLRGELSPELASQVSERYTEAMTQKDARGAIAGSVIASQIFHFIGQRDNAFNALVDCFSVQFMLADDEKAYADIHTALSQMVAVDRYGQGSPVILLRARILLADCGFFACEAAPDALTKKHWLQAALESLEHGVLHIADAHSPYLNLRFSSTAVAVYRRCVNNRWIGEPWAASRLAALTAALDQAVPSKVIYPDNESKTANIDYARAEMSAFYNGGVYTKQDISGHQLSGLFGRKHP